MRSAVVIGVHGGHQAGGASPQAGVPVTLADMAPHIFPTAALPEVAAEIEQRLEAQGVRQRFSRPIEAIERAGDGLEVCLAAASVYPATSPCCVSAPGPTPSWPTRVSGWTAASWSTLRWRPPAPGVYAAGACEGQQPAHRPDSDHRTLGQCRPAGETAGANIAGAFPAASCPGNITHNITHFMNMDFIGLGDVRMTGDRQTFPLSGGRGRVDLVARDGRLVCVNILDQYRVSGVLKHFLLKSLLEPGTELGPRRSGPSGAGGLAPIRSSTIWKD